MTEPKLHPGARVQVLGLRSPAAAANSRFMGFMRADKGTIIARDAYDPDAYVVALDEPTTDDEGQVVHEVVWLIDNLQAI